ncbi:MAG: bifunctional methylenetetrahydrofolate dehydrogenase/methenyltetrahydrofolate cyclohydrolase FolD [Candidatus Dormibacteraeota bacterium]|nr:bifunctional methylenetetrahydrofolate dehydrogenase/methenyltetrahydrofolate cyclohydrolase FolD [Candidatus Dormibacteraeota bacterium]
MSAIIVDGRGLARRIRDGIAAEVEEMVAAGSGPPGLGVVLVGDDPASAIYVRNKTKACDEAGFYSEQVNLPDDAGEARVLQAVAAFNQDPRIHGILVQLPLPPDVDELVVIGAIDGRKDADGIHPENVALLAVGRPRVLPCTPAGIMEILRDQGVQVEGAEAVVVGRSNIVGRPTLRLLELANATVTMAHSRTRDLGAVTRRADILVLAAGRPGLVTGDMVKPGATVVDVGMNRLPPKESGGKGRIVGDVDVESVSQVAGRLTPVPGGVGPMTIAMLLKNTLEAARAAAVTSAPV